DSANNLLWQVAVPAGASSPIVVGDRVFLTGFADGKLITLALNRADGAVVWRHEIAPEKLEPFIEKYASPAVPTCASDGERVVSFFGSHGLTCFDLDGTVLWDVPQPVAQSKDGFGTGTSPIIHDGLVYLQRDEDGPASGLYAFDAKTGALVWKQSRKEFRVSYATPTIWDGTLVLVGDTRAKGYDLKTGEERWLVRGLTAYPCTTPTAGGDGNLYIATWNPGVSADEPFPSFDDFLKMMDKDGDGKLSRAEVQGTPLQDFFDIQDKDKSGFIERAEWEGNMAWMKRGKNAVLAIKPGGRGDITESHVLWSAEKGAPYVASPLYYDGKLFMVKDGGFATLYDAATGKPLYEKQRFGVPGEYYVSPTLAGDRIYFGSGAGTLVVLDAKATDKPVLLGKLDLNEYLAASPAIVDGKIYVRTKEHLVALGAK
ncbi:MAG TPA: PQQ-binding-like beta-propeller repeat protein, partial [Chthoniobacteraceae bacterium]|nr:PQQ-binding-like beta-propeller repeat protein [Chthoniobacteraceae bacterium]